ncbi:MAG: hypothetical protein PVSMB1_15400 [Gemmatimonadaceae bacterium]
MSNVWLFVIGFVITIPVGAGVTGLIRAAVADGRTDDQVQKRRASSPRNS